MSDPEIGDRIPLLLEIPVGDVTTAVTLDWFHDATSTTGAVSPAPATPGSGDDQYKLWTASHLVDKSGAWRFVWTITGTGAGKETHTVWVSPTAPVPWVPTLRAVADYVPTRTIESGDVSQNPKMTFNDDTTPTGEQVDRQVRAAVRWVISRTGPVKESLYHHARDVAAIRTAGMVELSWPAREAGINTAQQLLAQAEAALKDLVEANTSASDDEPGDPNGALLPIWSSPAPTTTETIPASDTADWGGPAHWYRWD